ncbi:MAG: leucine-rich repeat domain-containing protein, partial [Paludibacteraceae bacterium]|nr:leucine-rich repeat domain-containing protein [Paludibacteraceae bacterium]
MKKSAILSLLLIVSAGTTFTRAYTVQIGNLHYMIDQNKLTAEVVSMPNYEKYYGDISIPESVEFESHTYNVIAIGDMAFKQCYGLTSVELPNSIISIGESAFEYCEALKSIVIPDNVTSIGNYAFWECLGMTSVMIGSGVTSIGKSAFYKCISVESFVIDAANTVYDSRDNCNALIESATNTLITGCKNTRTIPDGITSIQDGAFADCSELESIEFPNSLRSIGTQVFWGCTGLKSIIVPVNLTSLGSQPFYGCTGITSVTWNAKNCP